MQKCNYPGPAIQGKNKTSWLGRLCYYAQSLPAGRQDIHLVWRIAAGTERANFQRDFLKITAKEIIDILSRNDPDMIKKITVNLKDRKLQVWKRNSMSIDLFNEKFLLQKLNYIHNNPCQPKWELATHPFDYPYSSSKFYYNSEDRFQILKHYADI